MSRCSKCQKVLTAADFLDKEEIYLYSPRALLLSSEGYSNWCWGYEDGEYHSGEVRCLKHRLPNMVKIFSDIKIAKQWVKDMLLTNM